MNTTTNTETRSERDLQMIAEAEADYLSGATFARASHSTALSYQPPIRSDEYGKVIETLGRLAAEGDAAASIASRLVGSVNLYGTPSQVEAGLYRAAFEAISGGYDDVLGRTGPEAGRYSDHQHDHSIRTILLVACYIAEAVAPFASYVTGNGPGGWVLRALCEQYRIPCYDRRRFPYSNRRRPA
jgi:hypothetical protein